jgi:hypothetical protein
MVKTRFAYLIIINIFGNRFQIENTVAQQNKNKT